MKSLQILAVAHVLQKSNMWCINLQIIFKKIWTIPIFIIESIFIPELVISPWWAGIVVSGEAIGYLHLMSCWWCLMRRFVSVMIQYESRIHSYLCGLVSSSVSHPPSTTPKQNTPLWHLQAWDVLLWLSAHLRCGLSCVFDQGKCWYDCWKPFELAMVNCCIMVYHDRLVPLVLFHLICILWGFFALFVLLFLWWYCGLGSLMVYAKLIAKLIEFVRSETRTIVCCNPFNKSKTSEIVI